MMGPLLGMIVAVAFILLGNVVEGGHIAGLANLPAAMIVLGGTAGAVLVQYPMGVVSHGMKIAKKTFGKSTVDSAKLIDEIVEYANRARREGILALEKSAPSASHPFLAKALMMAIDGADSATLRETMEVSMSQAEAHDEEGAKVFEAAGGYAPTIGIIGAVLGLIHVMSNLSDIAAVGAGIASAFVATVYGVGAANIVCLPLAGRIKSMVHEETVSKELMLSGVLAIQEGMNPKLVRDRLSGFVHQAHGSKAGAAGEPAKAEA